MGRIKTQLVKRASMQLFKNNREELKTDFEGNKEVVSSLISVQSKKLRNIIAGYLTRLMKTKQD